MSKSLCLNMIVKNESPRILRALESAAPYISSWVIADTGSTDDTCAVIEKFFREKKIPGALVGCEFKDFSQARNVALTTARHLPIPFDYILLMDADMELRVADPTWLDDVHGDSFDMFQQAGSVVYPNRRLAKTGTTGIYLGVTHEYLNLESGGCIPKEKAYFHDHADGANRPEKYKRDIKLLKEAMKTDEHNVRYMYYLAQSYRDAGKPEKAAKWYKRRVKAGGWDEEVWSAQQCYAHCLKDMGDTDGFILETLIAYNMRPHRAETLYDLARYWREKGDNALACMAAETGMTIPKSTDGLFVNDYVYECGCKDEFAITAFYTPNKREQGFKVADQLSLQPGPYGFSRDLARSNLFHYHGDLKSLCPSFNWKPIDHAAVEDGWVGMNPSIASHEGTLYGILRTVNYKIDDQGRYLIRGTDGTANGTNPINTRNYLLRFTDDLSVNSMVEVLPDGNMPERKFNLVVGFEDMRLFNTPNCLAVSATFREATPEGWCEIWSAEIHPDSKHLVNILRQSHEPKVHEKNWMPIADGTERWMYRLDEITDGDGNNLKQPCKWDIGALGGGSQVIQFSTGWLCIVHEARQIPGQPTRFYMHRFVRFNSDFSVAAISQPFYFNEKGIEYAMGLACHPSHPELLVISYGFKDREARIATIDASEVEKFLG